MDIDETTENTINFVKIGAVLLFGLMFLGGSIGAIASGSTDLKTATLTLSEIPKDGNIINIGGHTFEFDSDNHIMSGNIPVVITSLYGTSNNLRAAIAANSNLQVN